MIKAVCFDLGDTLIAEESVVHNSYGEAVTADVVEGVHEILQTVRDQGFKTAIVGNVGTDARNIIEYCKLGDYFDAIVISQEVEVEKPDREIFQFALDRLKVKPEQAIMVGNRIDTDIVGANRMRMKSVYFKWNDRYENSIDTEEERPDFVVTHMSEVLGILREAA